MYFVLLPFVTNPLLTAASVICVTTYSNALTDRPSTKTSSVLVIHSLVLFRIVPFGLVSLFFTTFSSTISNSAVDGASCSLKPFSMPDVTVNCPWIYTSPFESWNVIFIKLLIYCGSQIL
jgi:hypothetical protein